MEDITHNAKKRREIQQIILKLMAEQKRDFPPGFALPPLRFEPKEPTAQQMHGSQNSQYIQNMYHYQLQQHQHHAHNVTRQLGESSNGINNKHLEDEDDEEEMEDDNIYDEEMDDEDDEVDHDQYNVDNQYYVDENYEDEFPEFDENASTQRTYYGDMGESDEWAGDLQEDDEEYE